MNREACDTFGKRGANMMKTDVKQTDNGYEVAVDLPGCKKEDVQMELDDGYLTIQAVRSHSNDEKDKKGRYLRRESFSGTCAPRHNAHKVAPESCNKPSGAIFVPGIFSAAARRGRIRAEPIHR